MKLLTYIRIAAAGVLLAAGQFASAQVQFSCTFQNSPTECGFNEQSFALPRAAVVSAVGRDGGTSVQLNTLPGDSNVAGSGTNERDDLQLNPSTAYCNQGQTEWWSHSVMFPNGYVAPPSGSTWNWGVVFDFHQTGSTGQPPFMVVTTPTGLEFRGAGGPTPVNGPGDPGYYSAVIGPITKNTWYDFVYNVKWSSNSDGFFKAWVNGVQKMNFSGPTLYPGVSCYLKLANYHTPLGVSVSVIHDRVIRGVTQADVTGGSSGGDTTPPTVSLTAPLSGATVSGAITMIASASDNVGVVGVQFKYNGVNTGPEMTAAPYTNVADTATVPNGTYTLTAVARDAAGNTKTSAPVTITVANGVTPPADTTAPSVPGGLGASAASTSQINLSWSASSDNVGVSGYKVFRGGVQIATTTTPAYSNTGLAASTAYSYTVAAYDAAGNNSAQSGLTIATTLAPPDTTAPSVPAGLNASAASTSQINLSWGASSDNVGVTGYKVFRGGVQVATTSSPSYADSGLARGTPYSYTVSAQDAAGNQSAPSAAVAATTVASGVRGDFNADGKADIPWRNSVTGQNSIWFMNGATLVSSADLATVADLSWKIVGMADFDGDGDADILWRNSGSGKNRIWFMKGATLTSSVDLPALSSNGWKFAGIGDFDGNGKPDILWRHSSSGQNQIWLMNGAAVVSTTSIAKVADLNWSVAAIGDFNGDAKSDILWRNGATGENAIWFMNGTTQTSGPSITAVADLNWGIAGVGDFDGDGKADILWRNKSTGQNSIWFMNGATVLSTPFINQVADLNWNVAGLGDFNGDGKTDVLWRNKSTGENAIFFMNAGTVTSSTLITSVPATEWAIALR